MFLAKSVDLFESSKNIVMQTCISLMGMMLWMKQEAACCF